jgi:hypothetical protein
MIRYQFVLESGTIIHSDFEESIDIAFIKLCDSYHTDDFYIKMKNVVSISKVFED